MNDDLTKKEWEILDDLLIRIAGMNRPTWKEKAQILIENLSESAN